jgi:hypothetical protein
MKIMRFSILLGLFATTLSLVACTPIQEHDCRLQPGYDHRSHSASRLGRALGQERFIFQAEPGMTEMKLRLAFKLSEGAVSWTYVDPAGEVRWQGMLQESGQWQQSREFPVEVGEWVLSISSQEGVGSYDVCWLAG